MDKTKEIIECMLKENTGKHLLDSGNYYGRHWEKNSNIDFEKTPRTNVNWKYKEFTISLYHFLVDNVRYEEKFDQVFQKFSNLEINSSKNWFEIVDSFIPYLKSKGLNIETEYNCYTYNEENRLSQDIVFTTFRYNLETYVILMIHNGCDARGGFTNPRIFSVYDSRFYDYNNVVLYCKECSIGFDVNSDVVCFQIGKPMPNQLELIKDTTPEYKREYEYAEKLKLILDDYSNDHNYDGKCPCCEHGVLEVDFS